MKGERGVTLLHNITASTKEGGPTLSSMIDRLPRRYVAAVRLPSSWPLRRRTAADAFELQGDLSKGVQSVRVESGVVPRRVTTAAAKRCGVLGTDAPSKEAVQAMTHRRINLWYWQNGYLIMRVPSRECHLLATCMLRRRQKLMHGSWAALYLHGMKGRSAASWMTASTRHWSLSRRGVESRRGVSGAMSARRSFW